jgi:hypothetical protein
MHYFALSLLLLLLHGSGAQPTPLPSVSPQILCWFPHDYPGLSRDVSIVLGYTTLTFKGGHIDAGTPQNNITPSIFTSALPTDFLHFNSLLDHVIHGVAGWLYDGNLIVWNLNGTTVTIDLSFIQNDSVMCRNALQGACPNFGNSSFDWIDFCSDNDYCNGREICVPFTISSAGTDTLRAQAHDVSFIGQCQSGEPVVCPPDFQCDNATEQCVGPPPTDAPTAEPTEAPTECPTQPPCSTGSDKALLWILVALCILVLILFFLYLVINRRRYRGPENKAV